MKLEFHSRTDLQGHLAPQHQGYVRLDVPCREIITDGEFVLPDVLSNDLVGCEAEGDGVVVHFGHSTHDESVQSGQFPGP